MAVSLLAKDEMKERIEERKLIVHKIAFDIKKAQDIIEKDKTKFFAKLSFFRPRQEDIECESVELLYEPFVVAEANYFLDYYREKSYTVRVREDVTEVIAFGQTIKPATMEEGILRRSGKAISFGAQERVIHEASTHMALNRLGREIDWKKLPDGPAEQDPKGSLERDIDKVKDLEIESEIILDRIRKKTAQRPPDVGKITKETFEVTEYALLCTPVYEARCRRVKTGEIRILPISGVTGKPIQP